MSNYTYLLLNILTILFPLILSFDKKVAFYTKWKSLFVSIVLVGIFFITWDYFFTKWGIWHFNNEYVLGYYFLELPLEEWLFFITVPYAVVFIYEVIKIYTGNFIMQKKAHIFSLFMALVLAVTAFFYFDKIYTSFTFLLASVLLFLHVFLFRSPFSGIFWIAYFIQLIPFLMVNGILTSLPVVIYNTQEMTGFRVFTIPVEDCIYSMIILLMNVTLYEAFLLIFKHKYKFKIL